MDMEKWATKLPTTQNKKGTFRRTTRGLNPKLNLKHSLAIPQLAIQPEESEIIRSHKQGEECFVSMLKKHLKILTPQSEVFFL